MTDVRTDIAIAERAIDRALASTRELRTPENDDGPVFDLMVALMVADGSLIAVRKALLD